MAGVVGADVERMGFAPFIEGPWTSRTSSRFWVLLVLAAVIATAGVVADSTATVTGAMIVAPLGAFALVRSDSDTLPGVAIAISLVPPLAVVGLLLQVGRYGDAAHAALLFGTNVAAIVATGTIVLLVYRVRDAAAGAGLDVGQVGGTTPAGIAALVVVVMVPLAVASRSLAADAALATQARPVAQQWATSAGWQVTFVDAVGSGVTVTALGPPPTVDPALLRQALNDNGMSDAGLTIRLVVGGTRYCAAGGTTCSAAAPGS